MSAAPNDFDELNSLASYLAGEQEQRTTDDGSGSTLHDAPGNARGEEGAAGNDTQEAPTEEGPAANESQDSVMSQPWEAPAEGSTESQAIEVADSQVTITDVDDTWMEDPSAGQFSVDASVCTACAKLYYLYPSLVCIRPHAYPEAPCLLCLKSRDRTGCVCAKFKDEQLGYLGLLQEAAKRYDSNRSPQNYRCLEVVQYWLLANNEVDLQATGGRGIALSNFIRHLVFVQTIITSDQLSSIRSRFQPVRLFDANFLAQGWKISNLKLLKPKALEGMAIHLAGIEPNRCCDRCKKEEGFFKQCIRLDLERTSGELSRKCSNCYLMTERECSFDETEGSEDSGGSASANPASTPTITSSSSSPLLGDLTFGPH